MLRIGRVNRLSVSRKTTAGFYLDGGDAGDIFLPPRQAPDPIIHSLGVGPSLGLHPAYSTAPPGAGGDHPLGVGPALGLHPAYSTASPGKRGSQK